MRTSRQRPHNGFEGSRDRCRKEGAIIGGSLGRRSVAMAENVRSHRFFLEHEPPKFRESWGRNRFVGVGVSVV